MSATGSAGGETSRLFTPRGGYFARNIIASLAALVRQPRASSGGSAFAPARKRLLLAALACVIAVAVSMVLVDAAALEGVARLPPGLVAGFNVITDYGRSGWVLVPAGLVLIALAAVNSPRLDRMSRAVLAALAVRFGFIFLGVGVPGLVVTVVKRWIGRARPSAAGPFAYEWFSWRPEYASLPSGHAAAVFSALVAIGALWPRTRPVLWIYALLIAISRVVVSAHYPSDVFAGAACGALGAILVREWFAARGLGFYIGSEGRIHALPGPSWRRVAKVAWALFAQ